jgi:hypothetical protein
MFCCREFPRLRLSSLLAQQPSFFDGKKLSAVEKFVTEIDHLLPQFCNIPVCERFCFRI